MELYSSAGGMTPNFQQFYALVKAKYGDNVPQELRDEFRAASKPLMKYTNILTFNTRAIALYVSLLIGEPWLYFVFEIICDDFIVRVYAPLP